MKEQRNKEIYLRRGDHAEGIYTRGGHIHREGHTNGGNMPTDRKCAWRVIHTEGYTNGWAYMRRGMHMKGHTHRRAYTWMNIHTEGNAHGRTYTQRRHIHCTDGKCSEPFFFFFLLVLCLCANKV